MNKEEKYYTRSNGEKIKISDMNTTHLINALGKKYINVFEATNEDDFNNKINELNMLKEDLHLRINKFHDEKIGGK